MAENKRKRRRSSKLNWVVISLVSMMTAFCLLQTLEDKNGYDFGLPEIEPPSLGFLYEAVESLGKPSPDEDKEAVPASAPMSDKLEVHFLNVGQGEAILVRGPQKTLLIDAGENDKGEQILRYLKDIGVTKLDLVIGTHPHADHIGGMDTVIRGIRTDRIILPKIPDSIVPTTVTYADLLLAIDEREVELLEAKPGAHYDLGKGAVITLLAPLAEYQDLNNMSVTARLEFGENSFLFTGDAEHPSEEAMLRSGRSLRADVLSVGHHGSNTSTGENFLQAVNPRIAVISCGLDNSYGHPRREVIELLGAYNIRVWRTDLNGTVVITSDGHQLKTVPEKE